MVGYLDFSGNIDTAIAIRTLVVGDDGRASVQAGAGIVADSVPEHEDLECHNKARALLAAIPAARRMTARRRAHAGGPGDARWIAFAGMGAPVDLRSTEGAVPPRRATSCVVTGPEALSYLQGQLSQDVEALGVGESAPSLLLQPTGKVDAWLRVTRIGDDELVLDVDAGPRRGGAGPARSASSCAPRSTLTPQRWPGWALRGPSVERREGVSPTVLAAADAAGRGSPGVDLLGDDVEPPGRRSTSSRRTRSRRCASSAGCRPWAPSSPTPPSPPRRASG